MAPADTAAAGKREKPTQYIKEVKDGSFPDDDHSYTVKEEEYEKFARMVEKRRQI